MGLVGGIGPFCTAVGDYVGTLGAEHFCCGHDLLLLWLRCLYTAKSLNLIIDGCHLAWRSFLVTCTALYSVQRGFDSRLAPRSSLVFETARLNGK